DSRQCRTRSSPRRRTRPRRTRPSPRPAPARSAPLRPRTEGPRAFPCVQPGFPSDPLLGRSPKTLSALGRVARSCDRQLALDVDLDADGDLLEAFVELTGPQSPGQLRLSVANRLAKLLDRGLGRRRVALHELGEQLGVLAKRRVARLDLPGHDRAYVRGDQHLEALFRRRPRA